MDNAELTQPTCPHCDGVVQHNDNFCGSCGKQIIAVQQVNANDQDDDAFTILKPTLAYYGITLLLLATYKLTSLFPHGFDGMIAITAIDTVIVLVFCILFYRELAPLFSIKNVKPGLIAMTVLCAMVGSVLVSMIADIINISISDDVFYSTYLFEDTSHPLLFAVFFIAVHPAIFEEVTFRGFIFTNVSHITNPKNAIYITGFIFGILHLAFISMLWLVPIGLVFAWMRWKYNTLWYGIVGHFVYNLCITVMEYNGWNLI